MESEYIALAHATKKAIWLQSLLLDIHILPDRPTMLFGNNQAAISFSHNNQFHKRLKHIDVCYHFTCKRIISNEITVTYCAFKDNQANLFTKALTRSAHKQQLAWIRLRSR